MLGDRAIVALIAVDLAPWHAPVAEIGLQPRHRLVQRGKALGVGGLVAIHSHTLMRCCLAVAAPLAHSASPQNTARLVAVDWRPKR
jgi:hypothetical protein